MPLKEMHLTIANKSYDIEIDFLDRGISDEKILVMKIKSQDEKYFTYEFRFDAPFLTCIEKKMDFMIDKASDMTKELISESVFEDKLIRISNGKKIRDPHYEFEKHSAFYKNR